MDKTDEQLISEYQEGYQEALSMLFSRYKIPIFNFAYRMVGTRADAEDITADVFLTVFSKKHAYKPRAKFSTWLYAVARNACISCLRKKKRMLSLWFEKKDGDLQEHAVVDTQDLSDQQLIEKERAVEVTRALNKLEGLQKQALILREYQKLSYQEISKVLDCSLDNVKVLIFRARETLRQHLMPLFKEGENHG